MLKRVSLFWLLVMIDADSSSQWVNSQPKLVGLVLGLTLGSFMVLHLYIHQQGISA